MQTIKNSIIFTAIKEGVSTHIMEKIIEFYPGSVNEVNENGSTVLSEAVKYDNTELVELLLSKGADPNINSTNSPILLAYKNKNYGIIESMIKNGSDINDVCNYHYTLLMLIGMNGDGDDCFDEKLIELLFNNGIDMDKQCEPKGTSALMTSSHSGRLSVVNQLINRGGKLDLVNYEGASALLFATKQGHIDIVRALLDGGADINIRTIKGDTAIDIACEGFHKHIVYLLLRRGCEIDEHHSTKTHTALENFMDGYKSYEKKFIIDAIESDNFMIAERMCRMNKDITDDDKNDLLIKIINVNNLELFKVLFGLWN